METIHNLDSLKNANTLIKKSLEEFVFISERDLNFEEVFPCIVETVFTCLDLWIDEDPDHFFKDLEAMLTIEKNTDNINWYVESLKDWLENS